MKFDRSGRLVFGTFIDAIQWQEALLKLSMWGKARESRYVCLCNVHVVVTSWCDDTYRSIINDADMATPDGMPVAWLLRHSGFHEQARINGPDLMWRLCEAAAKKEVPVFLYGSTTHTIEKLTKNLKSQFQDLQIAGTHSPPFRTLSYDEDEEIIGQINSSGAGIVFVALGCPKQEIWMADHRGKINAVLLGVGAAFDFHAGTLRRAPVWMQKIGLEWLFRLVMEPKRLWKRYLIYNTKFLLKIVPEIVQYRLNRNRVPSK